MRSLYLRILVVSLVILIVALVAFMGVFVSVTRPRIDTLLTQARSMQADEVARVFDREGRAATVAYLERLDGAWGLSHTLTDATGRDLMSGVDRSAMFAAARSAAGRPAEFGDEIVVVHSSSGGRFYLLGWGAPPFTIRDVLPYYFAILAVVALLCWWLAVGIVKPLRGLATVVDRFGKGDLTARAMTRRRDEIGDLGRAIDRMADRTQTLLTAERRLLQDISHELRSPLTRLGVAIELVCESEDQEAALDRLRKEAHRLTTLVASLIEVTRAEGDPAARKSERVGTVGLIHEIVESCALEARARSVTIDVSVDDRAAIRGDAELFRRAIDNVLRNAIRYAPAGTVVDVTCDERDADAVIAIRDRGPGVPEADLTRLGAPFFRVDESRDTASGGVGLGLSIARRAIHLHHGTLTAENADPGLRIVMTIPHLAS